MAILLNLVKFRVKIKSAQKNGICDIQNCNSYLSQFVNQSVNTYNYTMYSIHIPMTESLY